MFQLHYEDVCIESPLLPFHVQIGRLFAVPFFLSFYLKSSEENPDWNKLWYKLLIQNFDWLVDLYAYGFSIYSGKYLKTVKITRKWFSIENKVELIYEVVLFSDCGLSK